MRKQKNRYPQIRIRSKNELAKRISGKGFSKDEALELINDVLANQFRYWHDVKNFSEPEKGKFVRSCKGTPLGKLLYLIDKKLLAPFDGLAPDFIFGGLSNKNHVQAVYFLLGRRRKRTKLGLDISRFFERNKRQRIFYLFYKKCECSARASRLLADICCVPEGARNADGKEKILARGFAASPRLALWCNLDLFLRIGWKTKRFLKSRDSRIAIFVDDIGITASGVEKKTMNQLYGEIEKILMNHDPNQKLPLNSDKKQVDSYLDGKIEHLGLKIGRNKVSLGNKTRAKFCDIKRKLKKGGLVDIEREKLISRKKSYKKYEGYVRSLKN